jgi:tRNA nucleotidyltransferase (CCA-adding enzyme)
MNVYEIPLYIKNIIETIEAGGFEAWLVGGCVRDMLLFCTPSDYDITSSALPEEIEGIFEKTIKTGIRYGTVTVLCGKNKAEVTTFRVEQGYTDYRRPDEIVFTDKIEQDLARRDFTVNAMAFNPRKGLLDPFGGQNDLKRGLIRAVGSPALRFGEDALRILRAFRFAAKLNFEIEAGTSQALAQHMGLLGKISGERVKCELEKLLLTNHPELIFELERLGMFRAINIVTYTSLAVNKDAFRSLPKTAAARWAAVFFAFDIESSMAFQKLKFENALKREVTLLLNALYKTLPTDTVEIKQKLSIMPPSLFKTYLLTYATLTGTDVTQELSKLESIILSGEPYSLKMLAVNGTDIIANGIGKGRECGKTLKKLLDYVIEKPEENNYKKLIEKAKNLNNEAG